MFKNPLPELVQLFPLYLERVALDATEHPGVGVKLGQCCQKQRGGLWTVYELLDAIGFEEMQIHVHPNQVGDIVIVAVAKPGLIADFGMIGEVLPPLFVYGSTERLAAVVVDQIRSERLKGKKFFQIDLSDPVGKSPLFLQGNVTSEVSEEFPEILEDASTVVEDIHRLELVARLHRAFQINQSSISNLQHGGFSFFEARSSHHPSPLGVVYGVVPWMGFEPTTKDFRGPCSSAELPGRVQLDIIPIVLDCQDFSLPGSASRLMVRALRNALVRFLALR
jgi:hypothetical protein